MGPKNPIRATFPPCCARRERPRCCRAAKERDELAPLHSITSSARARSVRGIVETERLGGGQIDDEIEFGRLLDREVARLRPAQNLVDIVGGAPEQVREVWSIGHQTSRFDVLPKTVHRRQSRAERQGVDANSVGGYERVGNRHKVRPRGP